MNRSRAGFALASVLLVSVAECQAESWGRGEREDSGYSGYEDRGGERARGGSVGRGGASYRHRGWDRSAAGGSREREEDDPRGVEPYEALRRDSYSDESRMGYRPPGRGPEQGYYNQGGNQWDRRGPPEMGPREWSAEPGGHESPRSWSRGRGGGSGMGDPRMSDPRMSERPSAPSYGDYGSEMRHRAHGPSRFMGARDEGGWGGNPFAMGYGGGGAPGRGGPGRGQSPLGYGPPPSRYASEPRGGWGYEGGGEGRGSHGGHGGGRGYEYGGMRGGHGESRGSRGYDRGY